jgi:hypothetical protein
MRTKQAEYAFGSCIVRGATRYRQKGIGFEDVLPVSQVSGPPRYTPRSRIQGARAEERPEWTGPDHCRGDRIHIDQVELKGKTKNRYIDVMVSNISQDIVPSLMRALEDRYDRQGTVVGAFHSDEAKPHVHMLVPWTNKKGQAIRLKKGEWMRVGALMASITGHELTPNGQGRRRIDTKRWEADPEGARRLALEMTELDRGALAEIERILKLYGSISVYALREGTSREILGPPVAHISDLNLKQLRLLNKRGYAICFGPANDRLNSRIVWIDDVPAGQIPFLPIDALVVKASGGRYQAHIPLDRELDAAERQAVQKWLTATHDAHTVYERRYLPGFGNPAQPGAPPATVAEPRPVMPALTYQSYRDDVRRQQGVRKAHDLAFHQKTRTRGDDTLLQTVLRGWNDFYEGDAAAADFHYALYLLQQGLSDHDIVHMLITQSRDIVTRKRAALIPYTKRVIDRAIDWTFRHDTRIGGKTTGDDLTRIKPTT